MTTKQLSVLGLTAVLALGSVSAVMAQDYVASSSAIIDTLFQDATEVLFYALTVIFGFLGVLIGLFFGIRQITRRIGRPR